MDTMTNTTEQIETLTRDLETQPQRTELLLERGRLYFRSGAYDKAMNDFLHVKQIAGSHPEAEEYIVLLQEIFAFRHFDLYNP
ncbi:MAG TPA: hypothetical protein IAA13_09325 [Candidatus Alistipes merdigallinarum]|nr:hypothetical protein [Candidatus Alistipes merdigallinarum]